ncbi:MAG TPA: rRNA maturation RNase YbeY [Candidatus Paceibacterota bacterium]|jgi:probable rRNA maturation factor
MSVDIRNFTRSATPRLPFDKAVAAALPGWDISLVFAGETRAQSLNIALRGKDYVPNVLSYEAGEKSGEIIICPAVAKREAASYGFSVPQHLLFLFIHGLLHLKGLSHGATMDKRERAVLARVLNTPSLKNATTHSNRD